MSVSEHPVALRLERQVGGAAKLLATVMGLPLIDGIFPALIIAGALASPVGIVETGVLIFGGSATVAVILAEMEGSPREQLPSILLLGAVLVPVAALEAALAETLASVLDLDIFARFAGIVILAIAAKTASAKVGEWLPRPAVIIGLGLVASVEPAGAELAVSPDPVLVAKGAATAGVGVAFALSVALLGPRLRGAVDLDRFRFGSSVALGMLALSVLGVPGIPENAPVALGVLCVAAIFAYDPGGNADDADEADPAAAAPAERQSPPAPVADPTRADGGDGADPAPADALDEGADDGTGDGGEVGYGYPDEGDSREPWL